MEIKRALITGATKGLGKAIAECFLNNGWHVGINYQQDDKACESFFQNFSKDFFSIFKADISNKSNVKDMFDILKKQWGGIDVLINNAGITYSALLPDTSEQIFEKILQTNFYGAKYCTEEAASMMTKKGGHILNVSSIIAARGGYGLSAYSMSKAMLLGYTKDMAQELGAQNIKINAVFPGFLETNMTSELSLKIKEKIKQEHALKRFTTPKETAAFIYNICQTENISGQVFNLDSRVVE